MQKQIASEQPTADTSDRRSRTAAGEANPPLRPTDYGIYAIVNNSLAECSSCPVALPTSGLQCPPP